MLFEPRKSADLYISIQPFFGARMMATRHLAIKKEKYDPTKQQFIGNYILASDLITPNDLPHLWMLQAECTHQWASLNKDKCKWNHQKLTDLSQPTLLLFGDDYEKNAQERPLFSHSTDTRLFSYLRNGSTMLYLPSEGGEVEVTMQPRDQNNFATMLKEISNRVKQNEFGTHVHLASNGENIKLLFKFPNSKTSSLQLISRFSGEYWINVTYNNTKIAM